MIDKLELRQKHGNQPAHHCLVSLHLPWPLKWSSWAFPGLFPFGNSKLVITLFEILTGIHLSRAHVQVLPW